MEDLVNFAYSGRVQITMTNVQALLVGASYLNLKVAVTSGHGDDRDVVLLISEKKTFFGKNLV